MAEYTINKLEKKIYADTPIDGIDGQYNFGNVDNQLPIEIFNSTKFNRIRELHQSGEKNKIVFKFKEH